MGQGGCLALEDAYILGELLIKHNKNYSLAQKIYKNNRSKRIKYIQRRSLNQAKLNHIKNPLISSIRNIIMREIAKRKTNDFLGYDNRNNFLNDVRDSMNEFLISKEEDPIIFNAVFKTFVIKKG